MKKAFKVWMSILLILIVAVSFFSFDTFAASSIISLNGNGPYDVGDTVTVTVKYNSGGQKLYSFQGSITYDSSVMEYVSGGGSSSGGTVNIVDTNLSGETNITYKITFKAIASGDNYFVFKGAGSDGEKKYDASAGAPANVKKEKSEKDSSKTESDKSSNANLSSLKVNEGKLNPEFKSSVTEYTVQVDEDVSKLTVTASAAHGKATVIGAGTFDLEKGDNQRTVTVTAEDGSKKSYTINIKRKGKKEDKKTFNITVGSISCRIVNKISAKFIPENYDVIKTDFNETKVETLSDRNGKYILYYVRELSNNDLFLAQKDENGEFEKVDYLNFDNKLYILEDLQENLVAPAGYVESQCSIDDKTVSAYAFADENMSDFYIIYAYCDGESGFYRYDSEFKTMQREPLFSLEPIADVVGKNVESESLLNRFTNLGLVGKAVIALIAFAIVCIIVLIILFIIKISKFSSSKVPMISNDDYYGEYSSEDSFVFGENNEEPDNK